MMLMPCMSFNAVSWDFESGGVDQHGTGDEEACHFNVDQGEKTSSSQLQLSIADYDVPKYIFLASFTYSPLRCS